MPKLKEANPCCIQCRQPLIRVYEQDEDGGKIPTDRFGVNGENYFCSKTCWYLWAVEQCRARERILSGRRR